jgi:hypothetical protein
MICVVSITQRIIYLLQQVQHYKIDMMTNVYDMFQSHVHGNSIHLEHVNIKRNSIHVETIPTHIWYRATYDTCVLGPREGANVHIHMDIVIFTAASNVFGMNIYFLQCICIDFLARAQATRRMKTARFLPDFLKQN